jgi:restriction system protein
MAIPDFQTLMLPILRRLGQGQQTTTDLVDAMANEFALGEAEREQLLPSGRQRTIANRVHWALAYLHRSGLADRIARGTYAVSERGQEILDAPPQRITIGFLRRFPEFQTLRPDDARAPSSIASPDASIPTAAVESGSTPDDQIDAAVAMKDRLVRDELLALLQDRRPEFFERVVVELMLAMGYGSTAEGAGEVIGRTGDGGLDGVIREDSLGLDVIYLQAKRYRDSAITSDQLRSFAGALDDKGARKGVFITTSRFTTDAVKFADRQQMKRIVLIDGERLTQLMLRYDVGVRVDRSVILKRIDHDYFDPDEAT